MTNDRKPRVYVTQYSDKLNFAKAEHFGEVHFLTDREYRPLPCPPGTNTSVRHDIKRNMADYIPGIDYIVTTGSALPNILAGIEMASIPGKHQILKWNGRMNGYQKYQIEV